MSIDRRTVIAWGMAAPLGRAPTDSLHVRLEPAFAAARELDRLTSLAVYVRGNLVRRTFQNGLEDGCTLTNVKSISKGILGILVGIALDKGHLRHIEEPVAKYLPDKFTKTSGLHHLTIKHLLTMTGNLEPDFGAMGSSPNWIDHVVAKGPIGTLGQFSYSTPSTHILSVLLSRATGATTLAYAERHLFRPLGIVAYHWSKDPQGYYRGGNDMFLGTDDVARIGHLMLNEGVFRGSRVASARWVRQSVRKQVEITEEQGDPVGKLPLDGYGYLWWTMKLAGHEAYVGWGFGRQYLIVVPGLRAVVTLTSRYDSKGPDRHHRGITALIDPTIAAALAG